MLGCLFDMVVFFFAFLIRSYTENAEVAMCESKTFESVTLIFLCYYIILSLMKSFPINIRRGVLALISIYTRRNSESFCLVTETLLLPQSWSRCG